MGRRRSLGQDSLELLLDTICNTFGGVLFIAMMVVLLLQQTSKDVLPPTPLPPAEELQAQGLKLAALTRELARLQQVRASQAIVVEGLVSEAVHALLQQRRQLHETRTQLQAAVDQRRVENADLTVQVAQVEASNRQVVVDLESAIEEQKQAKSQLETERKSRTQDVRLPVVRSRVSKTEIGVILRYGRLYLWHDYDANQIRQGLNTRDFVVIEETDGEMFTQPNPIRGIPLDNSTESKTKIQRLLRPFDPNHHYIAVVTRPDTYGEFQILRDLLLAAGYEYRLMPLEEDTQISDTGGSGGQVQ